MGLDTCFLRFVGGGKMGVGVPYFVSEKCKKWRISAGLRRFFLVFYAFLIWFIKYL